jgi:hypothetical protein
LEEVPQRVSLGEKKLHLTLTAEARKKTLGPEKSFFVRVG